ncbi:MAG: hypothetical protein ACSHWR_04285 [Psychromonas sp.]
MNTHIASAAAEQNQVVFEVEQNIVNISGAANSNAININKINTTGETLERNVFELNKLVNQFKYE